MSAPYNRQLGNFIRQQRESKGWSLHDLAERSGLVESTIYRLEQGLRKPRAEMLQRLADPLDVRLADLYALAGLKLPSRPPHLAAYMRSEYGLPEPAVHEVEALVAELRKRYGIAPKGGQHDKRNNEVA